MGWQCGWGVGRADQAAHSRPCSNLARSQGRAEAAEAAEAEAAEAAEMQDDEAGLEAEADEAEDGGAEEL